MTPIVDALFIVVPALSVICFVLAVYWRSRAPLWLAVVALVPALGCIVMVLYQVTLGGANALLVGTLLASCGLLAVAVLATVMTSGLTPVSGARHDAALHGRRGARRFRSDAGAPGRCVRPIWERGRWWKRLLLILGGLGLYVVDGLIVYANWRSSEPADPYSGHGIALALGLIFVAGTGMFLAAGRSRW